MNETKSASDYVEFIQEIVDIFESLEENITICRKESLCNNNILNIFISQFTKGLGQIARHC